MHNQTVNEDKNKTLKCLEHGKKDPLTVGKTCLWILQYPTFSYKESQGITWTTCAGEAFPAVVGCISLMQLLGLETDLMPQS